MKFRLSVRVLLFVALSLTMIPLGILPAAASHDCAAPATVTLDRNEAWDLGVAYITTSVGDECAFTAVTLDRNTAWELGIAYLR